MHDAITTMLSDYENGHLSRRQLIVHLSAFVAAAASLPAYGQDKQSAVERTSSTFTATDVNHIALRVTDIDRSAEFYKRHLGLTETSRSRSSCFMRCRDKDFLALFRSGTAAMDHYCYSVEGYTAASAVAKLEKAGLRPRRQEERVYFDDPDGLEVQVASISHGA